MIKECFGEFLGTFILVFIGCSSVVGAVVFKQFELIEVALIWGGGVTTAIYLTNWMCPSHLNPAVSFGMVLIGQLEKRKLAPYVLSQFIGAFVAGWFVHMFFNGSIQSFEVANQIVRGEEGSQLSAMVFGEFFPNPTSAVQHVSFTGAFIGELLGTFVLMAMILLAIRYFQQYKFLIPIIIGGTVAEIIYFLAPFTQAGLNPARDFGPRLIAYMKGWGEFAFPDIPFSFLTVYILAPIIGALLASTIIKRLKIYPL